MAGRAFTVAFHLSGNLDSSFSRAFTSASSRVNGLRDEARRIKSEMRTLNREFQSGSIDVNRYREAQDRLAGQLERNIAVQRRYAQVQRTNREMAAGLVATSKSAVASMAAILPAALVTYGAVGTAVGSVKKAMNFEAELSTIKALTGATSAQMTQMSNLALKEGAATKYSALEAAQGIEELLKAGLTPAQVQAGALDAALNLATAGGLGLADSANIMSTALNSFKNDSMSAADAANILAGTANASATDVEELRLGLSASASVASGMGESFKDTNAALGVFANNGLKGSDAGTSLKTMLLNLAPTTKQQIALFKQMGLITKKGSNQFYDAHGNIKSMADISEVLRVHLKGLNNQQRQTFLKNAFGTDAIRAANILYKEGAKGINEFEKEMSNVTALDVAKEKMNNAAGSVEQLNGAFETLQIIAGETVLPLVKDVANGLADVFSKNTDKVKAWSQAFSSGASDILQPFIMQKPKFNPANQDPEYRAWYQQQMSLHNSYQNMDFGDKIVSSLDKATDKVSQWVDGPGGKAFNKIFTKLAGIAVQAWYKTLTSALSGSVNQLAQGNFASAGGLALGANILTGGLLFGAGKYVAKKGYKAVRNRASGTRATASSVAESSTTTSTRAATVESTPAPSTARRTSGGRGIRGNRPTTAQRIAAEARTTATTAAVESTSSRAMGVIEKTSKVLGKVALPLAVATEGYNVYKAKDKTKAAAEAAGGIGGGWAGAEIGAAIGTAILPGIGTAIGGLLGGGIGYFAGHKAAGKITDDVRKSSANSSTSQSTASININSEQINQSTSALVSQINLATQNFATLTSYIGQESGWIASLYGIQNQANNINMNAGLLASYLGQASGWIASLYGVQNNAANINKNAGFLASYIGQASGWVVSLYGIQSAADDVISDLGNLRKRINSAGVPGGSSKANMPAVQMHATGGIFNKPHLGMVAEAGYPESITPIRKGNKRSLAIWQKTGELIGAGSLFSKSTNIATNGGGHSFVFAPVIHGVDKNEIEPVISRERLNFEQQMNQYQRQKSRRSFKE